MAKSQLQPGKDESGGKDPELWQQAPERYVSNGDTLQDMTGGDAATYEGIVDYIMTGEEQQAPNEGEIVAAEEAGMLERNYPAEIDSSLDATPNPDREQISGTGMTSQPSYGGPAGVGFGGQGGDLATGVLDASGGLDAMTTGPETLVANTLAHASEYSGQGGDQAGGAMVQHTRDDAKLFKAAAGVDAGTLQSENANAISQLDGVVSSLTAQIDGLMGGLAGGLTGTYQGGQGALDSTFSSSFTQISNAFDNARGRVDGGAMEALDRIETSTSEAYSHIDSESERVLSEISGLISGETSRMNSEARAAGDAAVGFISQGQQRAQQANQAAVAEATAVGTSMAQAYRGRGNSGTEGKRDEARAQAAEQVATAYVAEENLPQASVDAVAAMEEEKTNIRATIDGMIRPIITETYPDLLNGSQSSIEAGAEAAKDDIRESNEAAVQSVEAEHTNIHQQLDQSEAQSAGQLIDVHQGASDDVAATNEAGQTSLEAIAGQMNFHIAQKKDQLDVLIGKNPMLPGDKLQEEVDMLKSELETNGADAQSALEGTAEESANTIDSIVDNATNSMNDITTRGVSAAGTMADQAVTGFGEMASGFESAISDQLMRYDNALGDLQQQVTDQCSEIYSRVSQGLETGVSSTEDGVNQFIQGFIDSLDQVVNGTGDDQMVGVIQAKAEEEAAKIPEPWSWDWVVSVVKVIVVIAVIVAIAVLVPIALPALAGAVGLTLTAGTLISAIAIGAVSSLLTEIVMQFVEHGFDFSEWDGLKILRETFVGGLVGAVTFGLGNVILRAGNAGRAAIQAGDKVDDIVGAFNRIAAPMVRNADDLSLLGEFVKAFGGSVVGDAVKAGLGPDEFPSIGNLLIGAGSKAVTSRLGAGIIEGYGLDPLDWRANGFTAFIEEVVKEVNGGNIEKAFENIDIDPAEVGGGDFTEDYQPSWSPTW